MTPRIVVHIGAPKAGSTFLQLATRAHPELWRAHGVHVPVLPEVAKIEANARLLANALGADAPAFWRAYPDITPESLDPAEVLARLVADWRPEREALLLSSENFDAQQARPLRALLPRDTVVTIVFFVRNHYEWVESYFRQLVKMMLFDRGITALVDDLVGDPYPSYCPDWAAIHAAWHEAFPDMRVVILEEAGDLLATFAAAARLCVPPDLPPLPPQNVSPDGYLVAYLLALPRPLAFSEFVLRRRAARKANAYWDAPRFRFLGQDDRERIRDRFADGNRRLLETLGRAYEGSPLDLDDTRAQHVELEDVYRTPAFDRYRARADSIYAASL